MPSDALLHGIAAGSWLISTGCYGVAKADEIGAYLKHTFGGREPGPDPDADVLARMDAAEAAAKPAE